MTKKNMPSFGDIIKQAKSGYPENQKDIKPDLQSDMSTEIQNAVETEIGITGIPDVQQTGNTDVEKTVEPEVGKYKEQPGNLTVKVDVNNTEIQKSVETEIGITGIPDVQQTGNTDVEKTVEPEVGKYKEQPSNLSVKMGVTNTRSKEVHTVNITIKTTEARRNHWAAEAKRRRTTMTAVMVEALIEAFGDAPEN